MNLTELADAIGPYATAALEATGTPGGVLAIGTVCDGKIAERAYGFSDLATGEEMNPSHTYRGGSLSKAMIGVAAARLVELGELDMDAPISQYGFRIENPLGPRPITMADLLTHHAGLALDTYEAAPEPVTAEIAGLLTAPEGRSPEYGGARLRWRHPVGERFVYSSAGLALAAEIVAELGESPWPEYVEDDITRQLGMESTAWPGGPDWPAIAARRMTGHMVFGDMAVRTPEIGSRTAPSTGMVTSAADQARFLLALLRSGSSGDALLTKRGVRDTTQPRAEYLYFGRSIGMHVARGFQARNVGTPTEAFGHAGAYTYGWWSVSWALPRLGLVVAAAGNGWDMRQYNFLHGTWPWLIGEEIARIASEGGARRAIRSQAYAAGLLTAERVNGLLGMPRMSEEDLFGLMASARPLPGRHVPQGWREADYHDGVRALEGARTPGEIRARLLKGGAGHALDLAALRLGARPSIVLEQSLTD